MTFDIIIVGSGLAGYTLARELRRLDSQSSILMITSDDGSYYSKPLLSTGFAKHKSAAALVTKTAHQMAQELNMQIYASTEVLGIDKTLKTVTVENTLAAINYSKALVLALGAEPIQIPLPKALDGRVLAINDLADYAQFNEQLGGQKNIAIIGSGLVGTEYANDMKAAGLNVDVIALDDGPLQTLLPPELSKAVEVELSKLGINWHFNTTIENAKVNEQGQLELLLSSGKQLCCDLVLSAVGLKPRVELAKSAKLNIAQGIVVDHFLQTDEPNIFALGDCAQINGQVLMYVAPLTLCAKALAKTLAGQSTAVSIPASPVIVKTPGCPVVANPPPLDSQGSWHIEGDSPDLKAMFIEDNGKLSGFALTGKKVIERMKLAKQLPAIL